MSLKNTTIECFNCGQPTPVLMCGMTKGYCQKCYSQIKGKEGTVNEIDFVMIDPLIEKSRGMDSRNETNSILLTTNFFPILPGENQNGTV